MKRDADLVREILLSVEAGHDGINSDVTTDQDIINYHLYLMIGRGFLDGKEINEGQWRIYGLTWDGHELLELIRDDVRWTTIKRITNDINCHNFEIIEQAARHIMEWRKG